MEADGDRDHWFCSAREALEYSFVDRVIDSPRNPEREERTDEHSSLTLRRSPFQMPAGPYVLPDFEERARPTVSAVRIPTRSCSGIASCSLGVQVDDASADVAGATAVPGVPGPGFADHHVHQLARWLLPYGMTAIYDAVHQAQVQTVCLQATASTQLLCCWPLIHPESVWRCLMLISSFISQRWRVCGAGLGHQIVAAEIDRICARVAADTISYHSGKSVEQVRRDIERDKILTAPQAGGMV